jgi:hypothetical protein
MAQGFRGNLAQLALLDILRMLSSGNRTGKLEISYAGKTGELYMENGNIVHAVTGTQLGESGVYSLVGWLEGDFIFTPGVPSPEISIDTVTEQLLLEAARQAEQWEDIKDVLSSTDAVFNISPSGSTSTISLRPIEWQVLAQINGERSVVEIGEILDLNEFDVARIIYSLTTAGLLYEVVGGSPRVREITDEAFFNTLTGIYTEIMGPIGPIIIEDEIKLLGEDKNAFPQDKLAELVERISLEIPDTKKRADFQKRMVMLLRG